MANADTEAAVATYISRRHRAVREEEEECGYRDEEGWNKSLFDKNDRDLEGSSLIHHYRCQEC